MGDTFRTHVCAVFVARFPMNNIFLLPPLVGQQTFQAFPRADIRIRIRRRIIRIRIHETAIRTIIRITAEQDTATPDNLFHFNFFQTAHSAVPAAISICASHDSRIPIHDSGIKQSREPISVTAPDGALYAAAYTKPQYVPLPALPPNRTPRKPLPIQ